MQESTTPTATVFTVRLTPRQRDALRQAARREDRSAGAVVRRLIESLALREPHAAQEEEEGDR